jgi:hypothetical protein
MIKENLTSGFLWSAKPIGYPSGRGMCFAARSSPLPDDDLEGAQVNALATWPGIHGGCGLGPA